jgi:hypothetical protein
VNPIRSTALAAVCAVFMAGPASAQQEPSEVTDGEIAKYKGIALAACTDGGVSRGEPKEKADAFCGCVVATLNKSMTRAEWQQAYFYSMKKQEKDEATVLAPHVSKLGNCRPK